MRICRDGVAGELARGSRRSSYETSLAGCFTGAVAREEHARIYQAIAAGDADLARAATLLHIVTNETWLREHLGPADDVPLDGD